MKLVGNSVAVTLIRQLAEQIVETGVFDEKDYSRPYKKVHKRIGLQPSLFDL